MATKDFEAIAGDYVFFMQHSTEAEQDRETYRAALKNFPDGRRDIRVLDFGCGNGDFSEPLFRSLNWSPELLRITLLEPAYEQRDAAAARLNQLTHHPIDSIDTEELIPQRAFDLIFANHVLYYVDDLTSTITRLVSALRRDGELFLAIAGWDNPLMQLWQTGFASRGEKVPYHSADEVEAVLVRQNIAFRRAAVEYELRFPDTTENRMRILQFLFGDHLFKLSLAPLLHALNVWESENEIVMVGSSQHFEIVARGDCDSQSTVTGQMNG